MPIPPRPRPHNPGGLAPVLALFPVLVLALFLALAPPGAASPAPAPPPAAPAPLPARFAADLALALEQAGGAAIVTGRDGWLFLPAEIEHLAAGTAWVEAATRAGADGPLQAILDTRDQLARAGIDLIFVPVPARAAVHADALSSAVVPGPDGVLPRLDKGDQAFLGLLAERGVRVVDLLPDFLAARRRGIEPSLRQDSHWSPAGLGIAARAIAAAIAARPPLAAGAPPVARPEKTMIELSGDLWRLLAEPRPARERIEVERLVAPGAADPPPFAPDRASPLLLLGDSHLLVFHQGGELHATGAGLPERLGQTLGLRLDLLGVRGSGATPARVSLRRRPEGLKGKKLVIWVVAARELSRSDWKKVPLVP